MPDLHPDEAPEEYEAPVIVPLGSVNDLTQSAQDGSITTTTISSDRSLKQEIEPLEDALARLRMVGTRSGAPETWDI